MMMQQEENSLKELEALQKIVPFAPFREIKALHPFDLNAYYSVRDELWDGMEGTASGSR